MLYISFFKHQNDDGSRPELCGLIQEEITRIKHLAVRGWNIHNLHRFLSHRLLIFGLADLPRCFLQSFLLTFFPWPFVHITVRSDNYIIISDHSSLIPIPIILMICYTFSMLMTSSAAPVHWWPFALNSIKISEKIINIFRQWRIVLWSICIIISLRNVNVYPSIGFVGPWLLNHFMIAQSNFLFSLNSLEILNQDTQVYTLKKSTFSFIDIKLNSSIIILQIWSWDGVVKITNEPTAFA